MKKTSKENIAISETIAKALGITFNNEEFSLGKWGEVDNWAQLEDSTLILLECEKGQKHPNTNVLKLYPYMEENPNIKIFLLHYFYPENRAPKNRLALCHFLGEKMEQLFAERFKYVSLSCTENEIAEKLWEHKKGLMQVLLTGKKRLIR
jgi:hypothetical protein